MFTDYNWPRHHKDAGIGKNGPTDAQTDAAIDMLANAGYEPDFTGEDHTGFAQNYLELAFAHCPKLMDQIGVQGALQAAWDENKRAMERALTAMDLNAARRYLDRMQQIEQVRKLI